MDLETDAGVFAAGKIDTGTRALLQEAPHPPNHARLLDLGCGAGAIGIAIALRAPTSDVWAVDVNDRALALTTTNAAGAGVADRVHPARPDDVDPALRFDAIYCNPPIRIGKPALHELLERWLGRLTDDGRAYLVVQKHLGADSLAKWLADSGWNVSRLASRVGYRILAVGRRR